MDLEEYGRYYKRYYRWSDRIVRHYVPNPSDAEDVLQEIWLTIWLNGRCFTEESSFLAWLRTVAKQYGNTLTRQLPTEWLDDPFVGQQSADLNETDPYELMVRRQIIQQANEALGLLTVEERAVLRMVDFEGASQDQVGRALHLNPDICLIRLQQGRERLYTEMSRRFEN